MDGTINLSNLNLISVLVGQFHLWSSMTSPFSHVWRLCYYIWWNFWCRWKIIVIVSVDHTRTYAHAHEPVWWTGWMGVHALRTWAKEKEIIVNPIQLLLHPFGKKKIPRFFFVAPLVSSTLRLWPDSAPHTSSIPSPESLFFLPYPPADIHSSPLTFRLKGFFYHYFLPPLKYLKLLLGFVRVWSGDLEMKTDSPLICRIWIGIACASGEQKFYWEKLGAQKLMNAKLSLSEAPLFPGSCKFS